ncbi:MAG: hypothetical protein ACLQUZ_04055, partial [Rhizomicrobium sp.]
RTSVPASIEIRERNVRAGALKAEQYSFNSSEPEFFVKDPHGEGRATDAENIRPFNLLPP